MYLLSIFPWFMFQPDSQYFTPETWASLISQYLFITSPYPSLIIYLTIASHTPLLPVLSTASPAFKLSLPSPGPLQRLLIRLLDWFSPPVNLCSLLVPNQSFQIIRLITRLPIRNSFMVPYCLLSKSKVLAWHTKPFMEGPHSLCTHTLTLLYPLRLYSTTSYIAIKLTSFS